MPAFMPGLQLSELFFGEIVQPLLAAHFPKLTYSAARLGPGSEVLGYDTLQSTDHDWGPQLQVFVSDADYPIAQAAISEALRHTLPPMFRGYSTYFGTPTDQALQIGGRPSLEHDQSGAINHRVTVHTVASFFQAYFGVDPRMTLQPADWLTVPAQKLLTIVSGRIFHDGLGELLAVQQRLRYYPDDVWLALLAAEWQRISQEEAFMGRCGEVGDEIGSRLIAARLIRELMRLCFLMERHYVPYSKWFGTAFARLVCAPTLLPIFAHIWQADIWQVREHHLSDAYSVVAQMHNALGITKPLPAQVSPFFDRPYRVIHADQFAAATRARIQDEMLRTIASFVGSIDQFADATDVLDYAGRCQLLRGIYAGELA